MPSARPAIALIGCGKMGGALLQGWVAAGLFDRTVVIEPNDLPYGLSESAGIRHFRSLDDLKTGDLDCALYILAVKPQVMEDACRALAPSVPPGALILSIAAGQTIAAYESRFGSDAAIIRAMPNTPAAIGKGITVAVANAHVTDAQKSLATEALRAAGLVEWVADEALIDAVTAVSGSGPAYVFHLIEAMAQAGQKAGLPADLSTALARQTVIGAAALAEVEADTDVATLRQNVTSPGGTTAAALSVLMGPDGLTDLMVRAVDAAQKRSRELSA